MAVFRSGGSAACSAGGIRWRGSGEGVKLADRSQIHARPGGSHQADHPRWHNGSVIRDGQWQLQNYKDSFKRSHRVLKSRRSSRRQQTLKHWQSQRLQEKQGLMYLPKILWVTISGGKIFLFKWPSGPPIDLSSGSGWVGLRHWSSGPDQNKRLRPFQIPWGPGRCCTM